MRRGIGFTLICFGLFLAVFGGAIRFWAQDRLVVLPINLYSTVDLTGRATYLDMSTVKERTADIATSQTIRADVPASTDQTLVVDISQVISTSDGKFIRASVERAAVDRRTGLAVNCCGESVDKEPVVHHGYLFKLPFNTPQNDVLMWDSTAADSYPAVYKGEDSIAGHKVYKFVLTVPAHQIQTQADSGLLVGEAKTWDVPVFNQSVKTFWVEPVTGTPLAVQVATKTTLRNSHNQDKVTVFSGTMQTDKVSPSADTLALVNASIKKIRILHELPPLQLGFGALLAGAGVAVLLWRRRPARVPRHAPVSPAVPRHDAPVSPAMAPAAEPRRRERTGAQLETVPGNSSRPRSSPRPWDEHAASWAAHAASADAASRAERSSGPSRHSGELPRVTPTVRPASFDPRRGSAPRSGPEPERRPERPAAPGAGDPTLARYLRPYLDGDTGANRRPPSAESTGAHRRPEFGEATSSHRRPEPIEATGSHRRPALNETTGSHRRPDVGEHTGAHRRPPVEHPSGAHQLLPVDGERAHHLLPVDDASTGAHRRPELDEDTGSYRRLDEQNEVHEASDWFSQIRPDGHGRHGRLDPDEWSSR